MSFDPSAFGKDVIWLGHSTNSAAESQFKGGCSRMVASLHRRFSGGNLRAIISEL
jgi:hypothetical protein